MANVFQKGTKFAQTALALLRRTIKLPQLFVHRYGVADFRGAAGDTINVKRPPLLRARDKGFRTSNAIVVDDLVQSSIAVQLTAFPYNAVHLSPEEATLDEVEYVRDVQAPQVTAIAEFYEELIASTLGSADFVYEVQYNPKTTGDIADPHKVALRARKHFTDARVPASGRFWLVGSSVSEAIAGHKELKDVDTSGLPEALREGVVGRLAGFTIIEVDTLAEDESYFVHETAVAIAQVAPVVPRGAVGGGSITGPAGTAITQIFDYDSLNAKDRSIVEAFAGAAVVKDPEVDDDGKIVVVNGEPKMDFFRAVKVLFGAPDTNESLAWTRSSTGTINGGTFYLTVDGEDTDPIDFDATNAEIKAALNLLDGVSGVKVTGTTTKTITFKEPVLLEIEDAALTGESPVMTVTKVS